MLRRSSTEKINVPMSAMIDVVFLLLVFFLVTYEEEIIEAHSAVNLPASARPTTPENRPSLVEIRIFPDHYSLGNRDQASLETVVNDLKMLARYDAEQTVVIKVSKTAPHRNLIALLDGCSEAGLEKLSIQTLH